MYRNIVVAYDGSDGARAALDVAAGLAAAGGASLTLVRSVEGRGAVPGLPATPDSDQVAKARHSLQAAVAELDPELGASPWVMAGPAGAAVLIVAKEIGADLIVTGSRGLGHGCEDAARQRRATGSARARATCWSCTLAGTELSRRRRGDADKARPPLHA